mgnify:CR=1 FL=1
MLRPPVDSGCLARTASEIAPGIIMITKRAANPQFTKNPSPSTMATTTTTVTIIVNSARRGLVSLAQEVLAAGFAVELAAAFVAVVPSAVTVVGLAAALVAGSSRGVRHVIGGIAGRCWTLFVCVSHIHQHIPLLPAEAGTSLRAANPAPTLALNCGRQTGCEQALNGVWGNHENSRQFL